MRSSIYQYMFQHHPDGLCLLDLQGRFIDVNATFEELSGYLSEEIIGRPFIDILPPATTVLELENDQAFWQKPCDALQLTVLTKSRCLLDIAITTKPILIDERLTAVYAIVKEATDHQDLIKHTEERLMQSEMLSTVGQLAAAVAHEVRNPLTTLRGFTQLLHRKSRHPNKRYYEIMLTELQRVDLILSQMLVLAKPQVASFAAHDIELTLQEVVSLIEAHAHLSTVAVDLQIGATAKPVLCNDVQMKQVFLNIMKNAIEAMPQGGHLKITLTSDDSHLEIAFADDGDGIPTKDQTHLGEPFFTTKASGTGLGLMVCKRIIERHGGAIHIASTVHVGTTVTIILPCICPESIESDSDNLYTR
ncbi:MAG: ATP-binding protein [Firmicutes bacterium]|nr:ATP-binding protein [Bacillota bacterium]